MLIRVFSVEELTSEEQASGTPANIGQAQRFRGKNV